MILDTAEMIRLSPTHTAQEIADKLGTTRASVRHMLRQYGIKAKRANGVYTEIQSLYKSGVHYTEIAERMGLTPSLVYQRLWRHGDIAGRPSSHPLSRHVRYRCGIGMGSYGETTPDVGEAIMAYACKHSCTVWGAVNELIGGKQ